jgi:hypothetical protein
MVRNEEHTELQAQQGIMPLREPPSISGELLALDF